MRQIFLYYSVTILLVVMLSCDDKNKTTYPKDEVEKVMSKTTENDVDSIQKELLSNPVDSINDSTAIANIHLNTTREVFENERRQFLKETDKLGSLKIKSVNGFFYDNKLAAIQIISYAQTAYKQGFIDGRFFYGWTSLYDLKYSEQRQDFRTFFNYIKGVKGIKVTDFCASDIPCSSFAKLIENPIKPCYTNDFLYPKYEMVNLADAVFRVFNIVERAKTILPQKRSNFYETESQKARTISDYQRVYDAAAIEINEVLTKRNEINSKKHKNDPSWSTIIIYYLPAYYKYQEDQRLEFERKRIERQKDIDKI